MNIATKAMKMAWAFYRAARPVGGYKSARESFGLALRAAWRKLRQMASLHSIRMARRVRMSTALAKGLRPLAVLILTPEMRVA